MAGTLIQLGAMVKGVLDPTLPLKASLKPINDVEVRRAYHTISVVKGRAYIFGGKTASSNGGGEEELADNAMEIVILPSSGVESSDYKKFDATKDSSPPSRFGHSAAVVDDRIYIFGGSDADGEALDEGGRMWVYDTVTDRWSYLDPASEKRPDARTQHASVSSELPQPPLKRTDENVAPQFEIDPAKVVPEPLAPDTYGTVIVQGGRNKAGQFLNDLWSFDVASRTWSELPEPPPPNAESPSLTIAGMRLYSFSRGQTSYIDLITGSSGIVPLEPWSSLPPPSSSPETQHPGDRTGASLIPVTTGQGRNYLALIGGTSNTGDLLDDIWVLQLPPAHGTAASVKDTIRSAIHKDTRESVWEEVKYCNADGVVIQEAQPGKGIGARRGLAAAKGTEVDGSSVVVWGGVDKDGRVRGDGLLVTVDI
jgi:hypothetical protein